MVVDAPNTAFALLLYKAMKNAVLNKGDYQVKSVGGTDQRMEAMKDKANVAGIMGLPFEIFRAVAAGLKDIGSATNFIGPYQSDCIAVMRDWAKANSDTLVRYIKTMVDARRWIFDPANKTQAVQVLVDRLKLNPDIAAQSLAAVTNPTTGMAKDTKFDMEGFKNVLKLRAEIEGQWAAIRLPPKSTSTCPITTKRSRACNEVNEARSNGRQLDKLTEARMLFHRCSACETPSRRRVIAGLGATAAAATMPSPAVRAQSARALIDVHHHFYPPAYVQMQREYERGRLPPPISELDCRAVNRADGQARCSHRVDFARIDSGRLVRWDTRASR